MIIKKLEKAYFYNSNERDIASDICLLTEKLYKERKSILVFCEDQESAKVVDDFLWAYKEDGFIPHSIEKKERSDIYPILVSTAIEKEYKHNVLLALNGVSIKAKEWHQFNSLYYFFDNQESKERENALFMWKSVSALDILCKYWVVKENKWVLERST